MHGSKATHSLVFALLSFGQRALNDGLVPKVVVVVGKDGRRAHIRFLTPSTRDLRAACHCMCTGRLFPPACCLISFHGRAGRRVQRRLRVCDHPLEARTAHALPFAFCLLRLRCASFLLPCGHLRPVAQWGLRCPPLLCTTPGSINQGWLLIH